MEINFFKSIPKSYSNLKRRVKNFKYSKNIKNLKYIKNIKNLKNLKNI